MFDFKLLLLLVVPIAIVYTACPTNPCPMCCPDARNHPISTFTPSSSGCLGYCNNLIYDNKTTTCCCVPDTATKGYQYCANWQKENNPVCDGSANKQVCDVPGRYCICRSGVVGSMYCSYSGSQNPTPTTLPAQTKENNPHCYGAYNWRICDTPGEYCDCLKADPANTMICYYNSSFSTTAST